MLKPTDDITLDLKFNVTTCKELDPWISLLPTLKAHGLAIAEKYDVPGKSIQLHLQNQSYYYTVKVAKGQCIAFIFLLGERNLDVIKTEYNSLIYILVSFLLPPNSSNSYSFYVFHRLKN